jgi:hypothetical protein
MMSRSRSSRSHSNQSRSHTKKTNEMVAHFVGKRKALILNHQLLGWSMGRGDGWVKRMSSAEIVTHPKEDERGPGPSHQARGHA